MRCVDKRFLKAESDRAGPLVQLLFAGFPVALFRDLYLLTEGTGTALGNAIVGGAASALAVGADGTSSYSWLANGGVQLNKTAQFKMPVRNVTNAWCIIAGVSIDTPTALSSGVATLPLMGVGSFAVSGQQRGSYNFVRFTSLAATTTNPELSYNNGGSGNALGSGVVATAVNVNQRFVCVMRHDGAGKITLDGYTGGGVLIYSGTFTVNPTQMVTDTTGGAIPSLQPVIGFDSAVGTTSKKVEWAGDLVGGSASFDDIQTICRAATALGAARGRPLT